MQTIARRATSAAVKRAAETVAGSLRRAGARKGVPGRFGFGSSAGGVRECTISRASSRNRLPEAFKGFQSTRRSLTRASRFICCASSDEMGHMEPAEASELLSTGDWAYVDVRTVEEFNAGHVKGSGSLRIERPN